MQINLNIKPLSVNEAWQGKRFKTPKYKKYINDVLFLLPLKFDIKPPYFISINLFFSNVSSDIDNPIKPLLDILQVKYNINDKDIYKLNIEKFVVKKGSEKIELTIIPYST